MSGASASLDALEDIVPFMRARRHQPEPGDLLAADLLAPDRLASAVAATPDVRGSDPQVQASLWWLGYSYRVAGGTLAAWIVAGSAPDPSIVAGCGVGVGRGRPSSLVVGPDAVEIHELDVLVERLFAGHLDRLAEVLRARHPIGRRLVWGNAAASIASCFGAVAAAAGAGTWRRRSTPASTRSPPPCRTISPHWARGRRRTRPTDAPPAACGGRPTRPTALCARTARCDDGVARVL